MDHAARGAIFEGFVFSEFYKNFVHRGEIPALYFWRDSNGREVDIVIDRGRKQVAVEIKSAQTVADDFFKGLVYWKRISKKKDAPCALVYGGDSAFTRSGVSVYPWFVL